MKCSPLMLGIPAPGLLDLTKSGGSPQEFWNSKFIYSVCFKLYPLSCGMFITISWDVILLPLCWSPCTESDESGWRQCPSHASAAPLQSSRLWLPQDRVDLPTFRVSTLVSRALEFQATEQYLLIQHRVRSLWDSSAFTESERVGRQGVSIL